MCPRANGTVLHHSYQEERLALLDFIHARGIKSVLVLSGDRHAVGVQRLMPHGDVVEFSASPMGTFFPPISVYSKSGGDEHMYDQVMGSVKLGWLRLSRTEAEFRLWTGEWAYNATLPAK